MSSQVWLSQGETHGAELSTNRMQEDHLSLTDRLAIFKTLLLQVDLEKLPRALQPQTVLG